MEIPERHPDVGGQAKVEVKAVLREEKAGAEAEAAGKGESRRQDCPVPENYRELWV